MSELHHICPLTTAGIEILLNNSNPATESGKNTQLSIVKSTLDSQGGRNQGTCAATPNHLDLLNFVAITEVQRTFRHNHRL